MLTAARGSIRWSYLEAARLTDCTITMGDDQRRHVVGRIQECNAAYLEQGPLVFVLFMQGREHAWPVEAIRLEVNGAATVLRAIVGIPVTGRIDGPISTAHA